MRGAKNFVKELSQIAEVFIATSICPECAGARISSVIEHFPEIDVANILIGSRKDLLHADILLDDGLHNLQSPNIKYPVLFRQPWNRCSFGSLTVSNYKEFLQLVNMICSEKSEVENPNVFVLVGPSGSGKKDVLKKMIQNPDYEYVKPYATCMDPYYQYLEKGTFLRLKEEGFFLETSSYAGTLYATTKDIIHATTSRGKKAVLMMDINGAISLKREFGKKCMLLFIKQRRESCIHSILQKEISIEEKTSRICNMDAEFHNEKFCDKTVEGTYEF